MTSRARVLSLINAAWTTQVLAVACELRIADLMAGAGTTAARLAAESGADEVAVRRLMRALVTLELCVELNDGRFALTDDGAMLRSDRDDSLCDWARLSGTQIWDNWRQLAHSVRTGESARRRLRGVDDFSHLDRNPANALEFNGAMVNLTRPVAEAAARELDWSGVCLAVDVGGGAGELIATVLRHHSHLRGMVHDLAHAAASARAHLEQRGVADRCEVMSGSFFEAVPAGADAYLLKSVLHNWEDRAAIAILGRCAAAMKPGGRVILFERLMAGRLGPGPEDRDVVRSDLNMLVGCGGRERTEREFAELFATVGMRLESSRPLAVGFHAIVGILAISPKRDAEGSVSC